MLPYSIGENSPKYALLMIRKYKFLWFRSASYQPLPCAGSPDSVAPFRSEEQGHRPEMVAVELNEEMVPREKFPEMVFHDGDVVEIVMFMGGGAR